MDNNEEAKRGSGTNIKLADRLRLKAQRDVTPEESLQKAQLQNTLDLLSRGLKIDLADLYEFLQDNYFEQIVPIIYAEDLSRYYALEIE